MAHKVYFYVPEKEVENTNLIFSISENRRKIGELHVSRRGVDWWPRAVKKNKIKFSWKRFTEVLEGN
jgi:hypothetical protein